MRMNEVNMIFVLFSIFDAISSVLIFICTVFSRQRFRAVTQFYVSPILLKESSAESVVVVIGW